MVLATLILGSCASIFRGAKQKVTFSSSKPAAVMDAKTNTMLCPQTPCTVKLKRSYSDHPVVFVTPDQKTKRINVKSSYTGIGYTLLDVLFWPSLIVDASTAAWMSYPKNIHAQLGGGSNAYDSDPTIVAGEANSMVSRDRPGATALERTIIRWNFDSEPRGARIFWRVISSVPSQVKNTNELYLTTTPYEETHSFNILGLTYRNSRDVTIEIKVSKRGYYDQVKRFNARQAIDQQEISGFFELVKKD